MNNLCQAPADSKFADFSPGWQLDQTAAAATQHRERTVEDNSGVIGGVALARADGRCVSQKIINIRA